MSSVSNLYKSVPHAVTGKGPQLTGGETEYEKRRREEREAKEEAKRKAKQAKEDKRKKEGGGSIARTWTYGPYIGQLKE